MFRESQDLPHLFCPLFFAVRSVSLLHVGRTQNDIFMVKGGESLVRHTFRTSEHKDGSCSEQLWNKEKKKKRKALWHLDNTGQSDLSLRMYSTNKPTDITHTTKLGERFLSTVCFRHSGAGLPCLMPDWSKLQGQNQLRTQTVHFLSVREQHGICKYYVCRLVWVISWVFLCWQQVQVQDDFTWTFMVRLILFHFLDLKSQ